MVCVGLPRLHPAASDAGDVSLGTRERLTLLVARRDGTELVPLFLGCSPNLPAEEAERLRAADSALDRFLGRDSGALQKEARDAFAGGIGRALAQVERRAEGIAAEPSAPVRGKVRSSRADRALIRKAEVDVARSGQPRERRVGGLNGPVLRVTLLPRPPIIERRPTVPRAVCRLGETEISSDGSSGESRQVVYCQTPSGDWVRCRAASAERPRRRGEGSS